MAYAGVGLLKVALVAFRQGLPVEATYVDVCYRLLRQGMLRQSWHRLAAWGTCQVGYGQL